MTSRIILLTVSALASVNFEVVAQRAFSMRSEAFNMRGDVVLVGNRIVTGASASADNTATTISNIDLDGDAATSINSSSADLSVPSGGSVVWAGLYWGGRSTNANRNKIDFKKAGGTYQTLTATQLDDGNTLSGLSGENHYQGFVDITTIVQAGGSGTYWGGDVQTQTGNGAADPYGTGYYGGWVMIVVYTDDTQPYRNITVYDGYNSAWSSTVTVPVSGFLTPATGTFSTKLGVVAWEGDLNITGDRLRIVSNVAANNVFNAANPTTNFFNSTITNSPRNPNTTNNFGVDFDYLTSNIQLPNNISSTNMYFNSTGDFYLPGALVFTIDINPVLLPVELLSFDTECEDQQTRILWSTASEHNNYQFQILKSINGRDYLKAATIGGAGNSNTVINYSWTDTEKNTGLTYYRLKQIDYDGSEKLFDPKAQRCFKSNSSPILSVQPNPFKESFTIRLNPENQVAQTQIRIANLTGQIVYQQTITPGFTFPESIASPWKEGVYVLLITDENGLTEKVLISKN